MFAPILERLRRLAGSHRERLSKVAIGLTGLATAGVLTFHFTMTLLHVQPDNPLRDRMYELVEGYMSPYFSQNWHLFAPGAEEPQKHIGVVCRFAEPGMPDTDIIDVTAPHYEQLHRYRITPSQRIIRAHVYPMMRVHPTKDPVTQKLEEKAENGTEEERALVQALAEGEAEQHEMGLRLLARIASAECDRRYPEHEIREVQVFYSQEHAPKFSQRNDPNAKGELLSLDYGSHPYEKIASY